MVSLPSTEIPIVDWSEWNNDADSRLKIAHQLTDACRRVGFAYIINHGISEDQINQAFSEAARLFGMSPELKLTAPHPPGFDVDRGYSSIGKEKSGLVSAVTDEQRKIALSIDEVRESFAMGSQENPREPNVWYDEELLPGFREWSLGFYWECNRLTMQLFQAVALGIGLPEDSLSKHHSGQENELRLVHYPSVPAQRLESGEAIRLAAHTDFDTFTLLFQDDVGGLEVERSSDDFIDVSPIEGAVVWNVGDYLMRWSNDRFVSTKHRVELPPLADRVEGQERITKERFSIPYFVCPDWDTVIETLPTCIDTVHPAKYGAISLAEYRAEKMAGCMMNH